MSPENNVTYLLEHVPPLTLQDLKKDFGNRFEIAFARLFLLYGYFVWRAPIVNGSRPDFLVVNPRGATGQPRLVEVTQLTKKEALEKKQKQIKNMKDSGLPWTLLTKENLLKVAAANPIYRRGL